MDTPTPQNTSAMDGKIDVFTRFITVNGKRMDAYEHGKKAWHFRVTPEQNARYWAKRKGMGHN